MKKLFVAAAVLLGFTANAQTKWVVDKAHSSVKFEVTHLLITDVEGNFKSFDGAMEATKADFSDAKINFTIDVNSINTDNEGRDNHLRGDDFFSAPKFAKITFNSKSFTPLGNNKYKLAGDITIKNVTKPINFDVSFGGTAEMRGTKKAGFKAVGSIKRTDFGIGTSGPAIGDDVQITVKVEMNQVK